MYRTVYVGSKVRSGRIVGRNMIGNVKLLQPSAVSSITVLTPEHWSLAINLWGLCMRCVFGSFYCTVCAINIRTSLNFFEQVKIKGLVRKQRLQMKINRHAYFIILFEVFSLYWATRSEIYRLILGKLKPLIIPSIFLFYFSFLR